MVLKPFRLFRYSNTILYLRYLKFRPHLNRRSWIIMTNPLSSSHTEAWHSPHGRRIRDVVLGMNDGLVTVVSFLGGLTESAISSRSVVLAGIMTGIAGSLSMFFGGYLASKSQSDFFQREREREWNEIHELPQMERNEVMEILERMSFTFEEARLFTDRLTSNPEVWHEFMMKEELGILDSSKGTPLRDGGRLGLSFLLGSIPPIVPYFLENNTGKAFNIALFVSVLSLSVLGVFKSRLTHEPAYKGALEMALFGGIAAILGLFTGSVLPRIVH